MYATAKLLKGRTSWKFVQGMKFCPRYSVQIKQHEEMDSAEPYVSSPEFTDPSAVVENPSLKVQTDFFVLLFQVLLWVYPWSTTSVMEPLKINIIKTFQTWGNTRTISA